MRRIKRILLAFLQMPYYRNHQATSGAVHNISKHEDAVKDVMISHGLQESARSLSRAERDLWLQDPSRCDMKDNTFISQPCGTHDSPDFIAKVDGKSYFFEGKSVRGSTKTPMHNSGVPKAGYIYVFTSERYNETTIYYGEDVCPPEDYNTFQELIQEHRKLDEKYNPQFINPFGLQHYTRPMIKHVGGIDYFRNPLRSRNEKRVLNAEGE